MIDLMIESNDRRHAQGCGLCHTNKLCVGILPSLFHSQPLLFLFGFFCNVSIGGRDARFTLRWLGSRSPSVLSRRYEDG